MNRVENLRRAREARWSDPAQRQALAERNRKRAKHAHTPTAAQKFSISPAPRQAVEGAHAQTISFLSELKLGMFTDEELSARFHEAETNVRQLSRLAGPLALNATGKLAQERVNMLSLQNEIQRRKLARLQREQVIEQNEE